MDVIGSQNPSCHMGTGVCEAVARLFNATLGWNTLLAGICFQGGCQEQRAGYRVMTCGQQQCANDFLITPGGSGDLPQLEVQM